MNPSCVTCHKLIDPIGFGLEKFDAVGGRREKLALQFGARGKKGEGSAPPRTVSLDIDSAGSVAGIPNSQFSSPAELGGILAKSPQCQECVVKQYFRYTSGRVDGPADRPLILKALEDFRNSDFKFRELVISLTLLREFPVKEGANHVAANYKPR